MKYNTNAPGFWQRFKSSIAAAILLVANLLVFTPFIIYHFNRDEFNISFSAILVNFYLLAFALGVLVLIAIGLILRGRPHSRFVAFILAIGVLTWLQSTFIVWNLGKLTGEKIVWEDFFWQGIIDGGIWVAVIVLALVFFARVARTAVIVSFVLVLGQLGHMAFLSLVKAEERVNSSTIARFSAPDSFYEFSRDKNVIIVLLDAFQSDIFEEIIEAEPRFRAELDGFVFFKETTSLFPLTELSIPSFFSGKTYQLDMPHKDFIRTSMNEETISTVFLDEGYVVDIAPLNVQYCGPHTNCFLIPFPYGASHGEIEGAVAAYLMDLSIFRVAPVFLRNFLVYRNQKWQFQRMTAEAVVGDKHFSSLAFLEDITDGAQAKEKKPTFKFLHLYATHRPYVMTKDCRPAGKTLPVNRVNAINVSKCSIERFAALMKKLKSIGVYDNSLIVLMSDHGSRDSILQRTNFHGENPELLATHKNIKSIAGSAMPVLVIKPPHGSGPLRVSSAQAMLSDLPATLTTLMGTKKIIDRGMPVFSIDPLQTRLRKFYNYWICTDCTDAGYFMPFEEFEIRGSVLDIVSWKYAGLKHSTNDASRPPEEIEFKPGGKTKYLRKNWHFKNKMHKGINKWGRWALGDSATLLLTLPKERDAELKVRLYAPKFNPSQSVTVRVDGKAIGTWDTPYIGEKYADYKMHVPMDSNRKTASLIEFEFAKHSNDYSAHTNDKDYALFFGSVSVSPLQQQERKAW